MKVWVVFVSLSRCLVLVMSTGMTVHASEVVNNKLENESRDCRSQAKNSGACRLGAAEVAYFEFREVVIPRAHTFDCGEAVANGRKWLSQMREVGDRNFKAGFVSLVDYQWGIQALEVWNQRLTLENCRQATGQNLRFFQCLGEEANHIAVCGRRFFPKF